MDNGSVWHDNPDFWDTFEDFLFPPESFEEAAEQVERLLVLTDIEPGNRVLDIPCGVGRHTGVLAERGLRVTGVDTTERYLEVARERTTDAETEFVHADMREFRREEAFDAVFNLYTSFGYFEAREDDERTARNFYESLKPGGTLVMSLTGKEILARQFEERTWHRQDGLYVLVEHQISENWSWIENTWIAVNDGETEEFTVAHRLYSAYELSELLKSVGFDDVSVYGDFEGSDYDQTADRLVVVAQK